MVLSFSTKFCLRLSESIFAVIMSPPTARGLFILKRTLTFLWRTSSRLWGFCTEHMRCLQRTPLGEIFINFQESRYLASLSAKEFSGLPKSQETFCPWRQWATSVLSHYLRLAVWVTWFSYHPSAVTLLWGIAVQMRHLQGPRWSFRHYRIHVIHPIPGYLCFGKFLIRLYYDGQVPTCRKCNRTGDKAVECKNIVCLNCDGLGHQAPDCIKPMYCICKSGQHLARNCPLSWHR